LGKKMIFPAFPQAPPSRKTPYKLWFLANYAEFEAKAATGTRSSSWNSSASPSPRQPESAPAPPAVSEWARAVDTECHMEKPNHAGQS